MCNQAIELTPEERNRLIELAAKELATKLYMGSFRGWSDRTRQGVFDATGRGLGELIWRGQFHGWMDRVQQGVVDAVGRLFVERLMRHPSFLDLLASKIAEKVANAIAKSAGVDDEPPARFDPS